MNKYFQSTLGFLRLMGFLEGLSLLILIFVAMPLKYLMEVPQWVKVIGPIHGALFIGYVILVLYVGADRKWRLFGNSAKLILSSFIPFGTFYTDKTILSKEED